MSKRILILDDDAEFNRLLTDIFSQADYAVCSAERASEALEILLRQEVDLIVADHRMPQMSGLEFVREVKAAGLHLPIVMVSGYLDNDTIRDLIREGIDGIFIKPLNIFSLLKKVSEVLKTYGRKEESSGELIGDAAEISLKSLPFVSEKGLEFKRKLLESAEFQRCLIIVGPPGMPYEEICRDLMNSTRKRETVLYLESALITRKLLKSELEKEMDGERLNICILNADKLSSGQEEILMEIEQSELAVPLRIVFTFSKAVEDLYDEGSISEEFYLFLGANELHVPSLMEMPEDILAVVEAELNSAVGNARLNPATRQLLTRQSWNDNLVSLRSVILRASTLARPGLPDFRHFQMAIDQIGANTGQEDSSSGDLNLLESFLATERKNYLKAVELLKMKAPD